MARFQITATRQIGSTSPFDGLSEFDIVHLDGLLKSNDSFTVYDTYHTIEYLIFEIHGLGNHLTLNCTPGLGFNKQFEGGVVDTDEETIQEEFHYSQVLTDPSNKSLLPTLKPRG